MRGCVSCSCFFVNERYKEAEMIIVGIGNYIGSCLNKFEFKLGNEKTFIHI